MSIPTQADSASPSSTGGQPAADPQHEQLFPPFPEPCGWTPAWEGTALGQPPTGMNIRNPKSKPKSKG